MAKETKKSEVASKETPEPTVVGGTGSPEVKVKASLPRRYRIGRAFGTEPVTIPAGELTEEDFAALMADPYLAVTVDAKANADS